MSVCLGASSCIKGCWQQALQCEGSFAPLYKYDDTFPKSGWECCILLQLSQKLASARLGIFRAWHLQAISVILELCRRWISCSSPLLVIFCGCSCVREGWRQPAPGKCPLLPFRKERRANMNWRNKLVSRRGLAAIRT